MHSTTIQEGGALQAIFRTTGHVIKRQRQLIIICTLLFRVINVAFQRGLERTVGPDFAAQMQTNAPAMPAELMQNLNWATIAPHLPILLIGSIVMIVIYLLVHITIILKVFQTVEGTELTLQQTVHQARRKLLPYIWTSILQALCLLGLFLLLIIPGIIFAVYRYFALYVVVYYGKSGMNALRESKEIVLNRWRKTLGYMLLIGIIAGLSILIVMGIVGALTNLFGDPILSEVIAQLVTYLAQAIVLVVITAFFLRWDKTRESFHVSKI